ncbi:MAG: cold-shock protein [Micrococcales bacterium]|jgi:cold shock protein|nr:cold-shock protein [Micrococcales bacterium]
MPSGTVKWFDTEKGFGFLAAEDGDEVFVHASALEPGVTLRPGSRVEFGVIDGRKGKQALSVTVLDAVSVTKARRRPAEEMSPVVEDLIKLLDSVGGQLRAGRYPDDAKAAKTALLLRAVADQLDV